MVLGLTPEPAASSRTDSKCAPGGFSDRSTPRSRTDDRAHPVGRIPPGAHLESVRELAAAAGVNPNTMQRALAYMESEGLLRTERTAGRYITDDAALLERLRRRSAHKIAKNTWIKCGISAMGRTRPQSLRPSGAKRRKRYEWILTCEGLSKRYGKSQTALDGVELHLEPGRIVGLLGPNGSGKTTLIKLANGLLQPSAGTVKIAGMTPGPETKALVSYLPDAAYLPDRMQVEQLVEMFRDFYADFDLNRAKEMLDRLSISPKAALKSLSKGNKEKVQLILAMSRRAKCYLLDEPIGGVDPAAREYILNTILTNYNEDALVVLSTHLIEDVEPVLDEAVFLKEGRVLAHRAVDEIRETEGKSVDAYFREVFKC